MVVLRVLSNLTSALDIHLLNTVMHAFSSSIHFITLFPFHSSPLSLFVPLTLVLVSPPPLSFYDSTTLSACTKPFFHVQNSKRFKAHAEKVIKSLFSMVELFPDVEAISKECSASIANIHKSNDVQILHNQVRSSGTHTHTHTM